ncbi:MAG TPA: hypothetical protein VNA13_05370 [Xanthomonadales bacterium]|nr:hypothetical protein [Xanthomonadales bacterium]
MTAHPKHTTHSEDEEKSQSYHHDVRTFLEWHAPGRPFAEHSKEYFINILLIMMALEIILFLFGQYMLMLVILSLAFLSFAMSLVPPHNFYYKITSEGIRVEDYFFIWEELYDFFFIKHHDKDVLYLTTKDFLTGELKVTLGDVPADEVKKALLPYLPYREYVKPTFTEKSGEWLSKNFPLEKKAS